MNKSVIDLALENNFQAKVSFLPAMCPTMTVDYFAGGVCSVNSTFASDTFNVVAARNLNTEIDIREAGSIISAFNIGNLPFSWWVGPNSATYGLDELLNFCGLEHVETELGMAAAASDIDSEISSFPENFKISTVNSIAAFEDYGNVLASVFNPFDVDAVMFYKTVAGFYKANSPLKMFVCYVDEEPVAISSCINSDGIGGVYDIVTKPSFQKRGLGTIMTKVAVRHLKLEGCNVIGMQASKDGIGIYKRLGFMTFGEFRVYSNKVLLNL